MICRTERPGKFYNMPTVHRLDAAQQLLLKCWTCDQPLGIVLLRCLDDLFPLGLIAHRCSTITRCRECVIKTCSDNACFPLNMDIPGSVLIASRSIIKIGLSAYHYFQILVGDHTVGACCTGMQARLAGTSVVHVFRPPVATFYRLPPKTTKMTGATRHR